LLGGESAIDAQGAEAEPQIEPAGDLTIKAAEAEADMLYVAGEARPGTLVRIYLDDDLVGEAKADEGGTWLLEAKRNVPPGKVVIRADAVRPDTAMAGEQVELPFVRHPDGVVLEPVVTASNAGSEANAYVPSPPVVIIRRGDNLWRISRRNYGRGIRYEAIYGANRDQIRDPHWIYPGQIFVMPMRDRSWESATN
jgi:nucleoid-associated protein YgaU